MDELIAAQRLELGLALTHTAGSEGAQRGALSRHAPPCVASLSDSFQPPGEAFAKTARSAAP